MNNRSFQKLINLVFTLTLTFGMLLPASTTLALPQKTVLVKLGNSNPNDTLYSSQWNLSGPWGINAPAAWTITNGSADIVVAVIDTGITNHDDLDGARILPGYDFISDMATANEFPDDPGRDADPSDPGDYNETATPNCPVSNSSWQGTHVAGTIGAASNNGQGIAGIDWGAKILPVRVFGRCGGSATDTIDGMRWAVGLPVSGVTDNPLANRARVLNVSVGLPGVACIAYQADIDAIIATGAVIIAAAGDDNANTSNFPANCNGVITVAATDAEGNRASFSNYGSTVEVSAPGGGNTHGGILSTANSGTTTPNSSGLYSIYTEKEGTGMAVAHVSGVVLLMLSGNPAMTPSQILQTLQKTAKAFPITSACTTSTCGSGIVDAGAALKPDLIITNVGLAPLTNPNDECPASQPLYSPGPYELFCVNITVKNQGGSNSGSISYRNVYVDRDPSALPRDVDGCILNSNGDTDSGDYFRQDLNASIPAGTEVTKGVKIRKQVSPGVYVNGLSADMHKIYAYTDAQCIVAEAFENNNNFANITINPPLFPASWMGGAVITSDKPVVAVGRPHIGSEVASYDGFSAGALTAYIPMLFKDAFGGSYDSAFYIQNLNVANTAKITINFYDNTGNLSCTVNDMVTPLASKGYWLPSQSCLPTGWVGGVVVTSDQNIVAIGRPHINGEVMTYDSFSSGSLTSYLPMLFKNAFGGTYNSAFYIQNVGSSLATIAINYYDSTTGTLICTVNDTVASLATKGYWVPSISCLPVGWVGGVVVTSDQPIVTVGRPHIGAQITTYNGFSAGAVSSYVPMLFKNAFSGGTYNAAFYVQNVDVSTANITIKYYDSTGNLSCTKTDTVATLASKGYWVPSETCLPVGWVGAVIVTSNKNIVAVGRPHIGVQVTTYNGFTSGSLVSYLPMLFKAAFGGSYNSAFYVQNTDPISAALITVKLYDVNGTLDCTINDTIPALSTRGYWVPGLTCSP